MDALEGDGGHRAHQAALVGRDDLNILGPDDHVHRLHGGKALVQALKLAVEELHHIVLMHDAIEDVALADEIRHEGVFRLVVNVLRCADLLDAALVHHHHGVGHGQGLLLIVGNIYKGNAHLLLDTLQLVLHILAQTQIQCAQGLVQ